MKPALFSVLCEIKEKTGEFPFTPFLCVLRSTLVGTLEISCADALIMVSFALSSPLLRELYGLNIYVVSICVSEAIALVQLLLFEISNSRNRFSDS